MKTFKEILTLLAGPMILIIGILLAIELVREMGEVLVK